MARKNRKRTRTDKASTRSVKVKQPRAAATRTKVSVDANNASDASDVQPGETSLSASQLDAVQTHRGQPDDGASDAVTLETLREEFASFRKFITAEALEKKGECSQCVELRDQRQDLVTERESLISERDAMIAERDSLAATQQLLQDERDSVAQERASLDAQRETLKAERDALATQRDSLESQRDSLTAQRDALIGEREALVTERNTLVAERDFLEEELISRETSGSTGDAASADDAAVIGSLRDEKNELRKQVVHLEARLVASEELVNQLQHQNSELASEIAESCVKQTIASPDSSSTEALTWEQRKELILKQMEEDSFDAEAFLESMNSETKASVADESPAQYVQQLHEAIENYKSEASRRDEEVRELRCLLDQQSETIAGGVAVGAAAVAETVDASELIQEERERLQQMQKDWQEKFREEEIAASLERAKLARERQQLAQKQAELEEQLVHIERESKQRQESGGSRRWLEKLGLADGA